MSGSALLVVAFDFGTTYSGYAFSFRNEPLKVQTNQGWVAGSDQLISLKTPTCVLLKPCGQFDSFGFEAEKKFADLAEDNKHHGWLLFRRFKMILHNNEAGIEKARLKLCYEPEAASIWCETISTDVKETWSEKGRQYMVIDLGGGTADISVHEKQIDNTLKELHKASGGPWGGTVVDDNYLEFLTNIFGEDPIKRFKEEQMEDYFQLLNEFEIKERSIKPE